MPTTSNFGWTTPADTDLVKDGAAAIRTLGNGIDTSLVDLKGGTTGQILSKASNTDLDYTWINNDQGDITEVVAGTGISGGGSSGSVTITNTVATAFDAKGDLVAGTGADTFAKLTVGANNTVLTADSSTATGLKWAVPSAGATNWTLLNAGGTALTAATTITVSSLSAKELLVLVDGASAGSGATFTLRLNSDSGNNYESFGLKLVSDPTYGPQFLQGVSLITSNYMELGVLAINTASTLDAAIYIDKTNETGTHRYNQSVGVNTPAGSSLAQAMNFQGLYKGSAAITSVSIISDSGNFDAGTIYIWGAN